MQKPNWKRALVSFASVLTLSGQSASIHTLWAQDTARAVSVPAGLQDSTSFQSAPIQHLPFAHFAIPFDIDRTGRLPQEVHLWVSADQGKSWLKYVTNSPDKRSFEFQAAAEGEYLFAVQTQDDRGVSALASAVPLRIMVDTTKPQVQLTADINSAGRLVIDYRIEDRFLSEESIRLAYALDGREQWEEIRVGRLTRDGHVWSGQIEQEMPRCHEIQLKLTASDLAQNSGEMVAKYNAPRTAAANPGMQLASQRAQTKPSQTLGQRETAPNVTADPSTIVGPNITPQLSGPRAAAVRMNQLAGAPAMPPSTPGTALPGSLVTRPTTETSNPPTSTGPSPAAPATASSKLAYGRLESPEGAIAWEPSSRKPAATPSAMIPSRSLGRTVSNPSDDPSDGSGLAQSAIEELPRPVAVEVEDSQMSKPVFQSDDPMVTNNPNTLSGIGDLELSSGSSTAAITTSPALNSVLEKADTASGTTRGTSLGSELGNSNINSSTNSTGSRNQPPTATASGQGIQVESAREGLPMDASRSSAALESAVDTRKPTEVEGQPANANDAYHSRSRSFSLDYSVDSLRGLAIADIELWGTDDRGNTWLKWGSDPDRESPFDVQVGDDGLYGFRMVIIGQNGLVSNRPNDGDPADMWINVDTKFPSVKITRALYGEGPDAGMLVIDYSCEDENLHDRPISLAYSERPTGPWSTITTGLKNTGIYLWKADPGLPQQVYLRIQAVDRAGNVQEHRLDLPINLRGLTPRGRIQGFRPIDPK